VRSKNFASTPDWDVLLISFILIMPPNRVIPAQAGTRLLFAFSMFYKAFSHAPACAGVTESLGLILTQQPPFQIANCTWLRFAFGMTLRATLPCQF
jgi:hypothetical protein